MYANIYQIRSSKYNFNKNIYESNPNQKNLYPETNRTNLNKRPNSTKYINYSKGNQNYINNNISNNNITKSKAFSNKRTNLSK
jgi:hypothetical protein